MPLPTVTYAASNADNADRRAEARFNNSTKHLGLSSGPPATAVFTAGAMGAPGTEAITLTYNQAITCASVDGTAQAVAAGGSATPASYDYTVSSGTAGVQTAQSLSGGTVTCGMSTTAVSGTTVTLTFAPTGTVTAGSTTFTATARQGADGNTVVNTTTPAQFQPVGDAVQATTT